VTVTSTDITKWLGAKLTATLSSDQITEAMQDASDYVDGKLTELGVSGSGHSYDMALKYATRASIWRQLDAMGIKPSTLDMGGTLNISSDVSQAVIQFMQMCDERIQSAALASAGNKSDFYIRRLRGGQGIR